MTAARPTFVVALVLVFALLGSGQQDAAPNKKPEDKAATAAQESDVEILSDTQGYDFRAYLQTVCVKVKENWYKQAPEEAYPPTKRTGTTVIHFAILRDGRIEGMRLVSPSGYIALDRAAWAAITASDPLDALPKEFRGQYVALKFRFRYNPEKPKQKKSKQK